MTKNTEHVIHIHSKQVIDNKPKLPTASVLAEGEIAVNYAEDVETLSIKNESGTVVTFSSDNYYKEQYLAWEKGENVGSAKIVGNSGFTSGAFAISEGYMTVASGMSSHAEGQGSSATSMASHAEGLMALASGMVSHAEGVQTSATSMASHVEGYMTVASGDQGAHAEGTGTLANGGNGAHAEGAGTLASGQASHAEGFETSALTQASHTEGYHTIANNDSEHASGQFNVSSSASTSFGDSGNTLFSVGNGTADNARHNAFEIRQNGDIYIVSGGTDILLQDHIGASGPTYTPGNGIDITNDVISVTGKTDISAFTAHTGDSTIHVASSDKTAWNNKIGYAEYDSTDKNIYFYKNNTDTATSLCYVDATDFIKDGMVDNVEVKDVTSGGSQVTCLVITFNTDSGKEDINIPISDIFDASNYYTKSETSGATELSTAFTTIDNKFGTGFTVSSVTEVIEEDERITAAALNDLEERKLDASAYTPTDLSNYYKKDETSGATELSTAFAGKADTSHTHVASAVTAMTGYEIATSASSISTTDTLIEAIGKLEKRIALLEAALIVQNNGDVYGAGGDYE